MSEKELKGLEFNEYVKIFNEGETILNTNKLRESYIAKRNGNLLLINETLLLCKTYEKNECLQHVNGYCSKIDLNDILDIIETKLKKKVEYVKRFHFENICSITNDYVFLLK